MFGFLDTSEIESLLHSQIVGRIGCHAGGITYVVPISYAYDGESIFLHTREGMKINIMRENPNVCFQVEEMTNMANWKSVISWGIFEEITDTPERNHAVKQLTHRAFPLMVSKTVHLSDAWPFETAEIPYVDGIIARIRLTEKTGRFENDSLQSKSS